MIRLQDIRYRYPGTDWVLRGIDLSVDEGEYVFICGASGSGKSTLGYLFNGLIPHFFGGTLQGTALVDGTDTSRRRVSDLLSHVGLVLQNADAQLFNSTVENEIAYGLESLGLASGEIDRRIGEISETLRIVGLLDRSPTTLSGGEKRLVAIASVLCLSPSLLLLDEPYAHLDWEGVKRVREALLEINRSGTSIVVIEQRICGFLDDATRCLILDQGKLMFDGPPKEAQGALLSEHLIPQYPKRPQRTASGRDPLLVVEDLYCRREDEDILNGVSFELRNGDTVALVGRNGSGKTTLIKHFNGLLRSKRGKVLFMGERVHGKPPLEMAASVGLSLQNPNDQFFKYRVRDELLVGPKLLGKRRDAWFNEICDLFDLHYLMDRPPYRLSEGQKKRVSFASILAMHPQFLVFDEPSVGQDGRFKEALAHVLTELETRGITTLIVTHDLEFARATADRWLVLHDGRLVADGSPQALWWNDQLIRLGALAKPESAGMDALLRSGGGTI